MEFLEASFNGTLRMIVILLIIWWVLRSLLKLGQRSGAPKWMSWTNDTSRPKGDIRIERLKDEKRNGGSSKGNITDADFEEVK
jgi:hypothetical protein